MDVKLNNAIRTVLYRESGKTTVSHLLSTLRVMGWKRLGSTPEFISECEKVGYVIEYQYKMTDMSGKPSRTFILLSELETA